MLMCTMDGVLFGNEGVAHAVASAIQGMKGTASGTSFTSADMLKAINHVVQVNNLPVLAGAMMQSKYWQLRAGILVFDAHRDVRRGRVMAVIREAARNTAATGGAHPSNQSEAAH